MTEAVVLRGVRVVEPGVGIGPPTSVCLTGGRVVTVGEDAAACPARSVELDGLLLAPGLIDLQVNGAAGHDTTDEPASIWAVGEAIAATGVTAFLPTVITAPAGRIEDALAVLEEGPPAGYRGAMPLGLHLEGPFLSPDRYGAHDPAFLRWPDPAFAAGWSRAAGVAIVTLAPDLPGSLDLIRTLAAKGVVVSLGHSSATLEEAQAGIEAGARYATHLFNAMPPMAHREPGIAVAVLADERVTVGTIPDMIHVHPAMLDIAWRIAGPERFSIVTDAMAALGMPHGSFRLADRECTVDDTGPRLPDGTARGEHPAARRRRAEPGRGHGTRCRDGPLRGDDRARPPARPVRPRPHRARRPGRPHDPDPGLRRRRHDRRRRARVGRPAARPRGAGVGLRDEILEQPEVATRFLRDGLPQVRRIADALDGRDLDVVLIAARGTSDHAAIYAQYLFGALHRLPVALAMPSLVSLYGIAPRLDRALVIGISQSGRSPDVVAVIEAARAQGAPTIAITNAPGSPLARAAEHSIDVAAGPELATAATKTYTAQLLAVAALAAALPASPDAQSLGGSPAERCASLDAVPGALSAALAVEHDAAALAEARRDLDQCTVLGRAFDYATAREWSLKLKELAQVHAEPYSSADFQHGPLALVEPGYQVLAVAPSGVAGSDLAKLVRRLREEHEVDALVVSDDPAIRAAGSASLALPAGLPEWLMPIVSIVPGQLFALYLTVARGLDPERPRWISKVTETR